MLATEWAKHGITVNAIAPTVFRSKLTAWMWTATTSRPTDAGPLARRAFRLAGSARSRTLIGMAIYLLSPASDFCTGQVMYVDGGFTAG